MKTPGNIDDKVSRDELEELPLGQQANGEVHMKTYLLIVVCLFFTVTCTPST